VPRLSHIPLVFYSATYTEPADEKFATSLGADAFFVKPQEPDVLVALLESVIRRHEEERIQARSADDRDEADVLREYSERLVSKLESTIVELKKSNTDLRSALEVLSDEVDVKSQLITQLNEDLHKREAEEADQREKLVSIVRSWPMAVIILEPDRRVRMANPEAERLLGFAPGEMIGNVYGIDDDSEARFAEIVRSGKAEPHGAYTYTRADGSEARFTMIAGPSLDDEGAVTAVVVMLAEVTG
jgi:PAS domain S-box-containing protein